MGYILPIVFCDIYTFLVVERVSAVLRQAYVHLSTLFLATSTGFSPLIVMFWLPRSWLLITA